MHKQALDREAHMQICFNPPVPVCWLLFLKLFGPQYQLPLSSQPEEQREQLLVREGNTVLGAQLSELCGCPGLPIFGTDGLSHCFWQCSVFCLGLWAESCFSQTLCTMPCWQFCVFSVLVNAKGKRNCN